MLPGLPRCGFRLVWTLAAKLAFERNAQLPWPWVPPVPRGARLPVQRWRLDVARTVLPCRYGCSCLAAQPVWSRHAPDFLLAPLRGCGSWRSGIARKLLCGAIRRIRLGRGAVRLRWRMVHVVLLAARRFYRPGVANTDTDRSGSVPWPARRAHGRAGPFGARHTQSRGLEAKPGAGMRGLPSP